MRTSVVELLVDIFSRNTRSRYTRSICCTTLQTNKDVVAMMCVLFIDGMAGDINNERLDHKVYVRKGMNTSQLCVLF